MSEMIEREVKVKEYQVTFDEQEYRFLREAVLFLESIAGGRRHVESLARLESKAAEIVGGLGEKVKATEPQEKPDWWPEDMKWHLSEDKLTSEQIVELAKDNHIWVNAFSALSPSDEVLIEIGRNVLRMLNQSHLRTSGFGEEDQRGRKAGESPVVYIRINKS